MNRERCALGVSPLHRCSTAAPAFCGVRHGKEFLPSFLMHTPDKSLSAQIKNASEVDFRPHRRLAMFIEQMNQFASVPFTRLTVAFCGIWKCP